VRSGEPFIEVQAEYGFDAALDTLIMDRPGLEESPYFSEYVVAFDSAATGDILGPIQGPGQLPGTQAFSVIQLIEKNPAGVWELEEIREQLRQNLVQQKIQESLLRELRDRMHVEVRWGG